MLRPQAKEGTLERGAYAKRDVYNAQAGTACTVSHVLSQQLRKECNSKVRCNRTLCDADAASHRVRLI
jgi:hypothetical protein